MPLIEEEDRAVHIENFPDEVMLLPEVLEILEVEVVATNARAEANELLENFNQIREADI